MNGHELAEKVQKMATEFQTLSAEYGGLEGDYAVKWLQLKELFPEETDKKINQRMAASETGRRMAVVKHLLKGYEKQMAADKAMLRVLETEWRNS